MDDVDKKIEESFRQWVNLWGLEGMTPGDIYGAGFQHGLEATETEPGID